MRSFEFIRSESLLKGRAFHIRRDFLRTPDGHETKYDIVEHGGSVVMLPIDNEGNLILVRQYRHAAGKDLLELPAGTRDGEEPYEQCAMRELREEIGMEAGALERVGEFYLAPGYSTEYMVVFVARHLLDNPLPGDEDEFIEIERIPVKAALNMALKGQIPDAKSLAAFFVARESISTYL